MAKPRRPKLSKAPVDYAKIGASLFNVPPLPEPAKHPETPSASRQRPMDLVPAVDWLIPPRDGTTPSRVTGFAHGLLSWFVYGKGGLKEAVNFLAPRWGSVRVRRLVGGPSALGEAVDVWEFDRGVRVYAFRGSTNVPQVAGYAWTPRMTEFPGLPTNVTVYDGLQRALNEYVDIALRDVVKAVSDGLRVVCTGHSLGASAAQLVTVLAERLTGAPLAGCLCFGQPTFLLELGGAGHLPGKTPTTLYENGGDPVINLAVNGVAWSSGVRGLAAREVVGPRKYAHSIDTMGQHGGSFTLVAAGFARVFSPSERGILAPEVWRQARDEKEFYERLSAVNGHSFSLYDDALEQLCRHDNATPDPFFFDLVKFSDLMPSVPGIL